jgi:3-oxoacyl-[acyl-carrier protein] reductase
MKPLSLGEKVVLVTGGSRGIGRAIGEAALEAGAKVVFCARRLEPEALEWARTNPTRIVAICADVSQENEVETLFEAASGAFGRVDVVVNNAAISREQLLVAATDEEWDEVMGVNCDGAFLVARRAVRTFLAQQSGGNLVSIGSLVQNGAPSNAIYAASKGALVGLTRALAEQYGEREIQAHLVVAGYVETAMTQGLPAAMRRAVIELCPLRRKAEAAEIAAVVLFLASGRGRALNGGAIHVAGGLREVNG